MWFPDLSDPALSPDTAFLLLAGAELFDAQTPNTYTPCLHDAVSLAGELASVAQRGLGREELRGSVQEEMLRLRCRAAAATLLTCLEG